MEAAFLASAGVSANLEILEQSGGILQLYGSDGSPGFDPEFDVRSLGSAMDKNPVVRKKWPVSSRAG